MATTHHNASPLRAQNSHHATTGDHVTIQNGHRATTPAHFVHKIRTGATMGDHVTIQNGHRTTTPAHFVHKIRTGATTGDHVTIQNCHRATRAHTIITSSSRRENNIFKLFQTREARYDCRFSYSRAPLFDHNVLQVLRLPREMILSCWKCCAGHTKKIITCSKCCACHAKWSLAAENAALATREQS